MNRWAERGLAVVLTLTVVAILLGCGGIQKAIQEEQKKQQRRDQLDAIATAYFDFRTDNNEQSPSQVADLEKYLQPEPLAALNNGEFLVVWDADFDGMKKGKETYVLAYESAAPTSGGFVLMADEDVKEMTAAEFNAAPKAPTKPPQKKKEDKKP
jgi:hypothetical protein